MARLVFVLTLALALAGCSDGGGDDPDTTTTDTTTTDTTTTATTTTPGGQNETGPMYINGTVSGTVDCQLAAQGQSPQSPSEMAVPAEASNRPYALTFTSDSPAASLCMAWDDGPFSSAHSGTVPEGVTTVRVAADAASTGAAYSIEIV